MHLQVECPRDNADLAAKAMDAFFGLAIHGYLSTFRLLETYELPAGPRFVAVEQDELELQIRADPNWNTAAAPHRL